MSSENLQVHLLGDERVLASCLDGGYEFSATNRRVLKYKPKGNIFGTEVLHDLSYSEITSLSLIKTGASLKWAIIGVILILVGLFADPYSISSNSVVVLIFGILALIYAFLKRKNYFQFKGPGLLISDDEKDIWRINTVNATDVNDLVRIVRENLV